MLWMLIRPHTTNDLLDKMITLLITDVAILTVIKKRNVY